MKKQRVRGCAAVYRYATMCGCLIALGDCRQQTMSPQRLPPVAWVLWAYPKAQHHRTWLTSCCRPCPTAPLHRFTHISLHPCPPSRVALSISPIIEPYLTRPDCPDRLASDLSSPHTHCIDRQHFAHTPLYIHRLRTTCLRSPKQPSPNSPSSATTRSTARW